MTSCQFLKMAAAAAPYYFRFPNCWCQFFRKSNSVIKPNVVDILNLRLRYNCFCFRKKTSAILEFYCRFWFRLYYHHRHVILHQPATYYLYWTARYGNMTSDPFLRWQPRPVNTTAGFMFVDVAAFTRPKSISKPNFVHISQFTAEI